MSIYYIDFFGGNDSLDGLSPQCARRRQESLILNAGDSVLFKRGTEFCGTLNIVSGDEDNPIKYGAYGQGSEPIFYASTNLSDENL